LILELLPTPCPLSARELAIRALDVGLIAPLVTATTPDATAVPQATVVMREQLAQDIGTFYEPEAGVFALTAWRANHVVFEPNLLDYAATTVGDNDGGAVDGDDGGGEGDERATNAASAGAQVRVTDAIPGETAAQRRKRWDREGFTVTSLHKTTHTSIETARVGRQEGDFVWLRRAIGFRESGSRLGTKPEGQA
jgi:hypothetical protein